MVAGAPQSRRQLAGSKQRTRQWPPGQSTSQLPAQVTSHIAAPSQCALLPSPTVATQLFATYWHAMVLLAPHVAAQLSAFWQAAVHPSPPVSVHARLWFAQKSEQLTPPPHACAHDAPSGQ